MRRPTDAPISALATVALLAATACTSGPRHRESGLNPRGEVSPPAVVRSCETHTARLCATWNRVDDHYEARWPNGSTAILTIVRFGTDVVVFERRDTGGPTPHMHAFYYGIPRDGWITAGVVAWNDRGQTFEGRWEASWVDPDVRRDPQG